ncbi:MAG: acyl-ACP--UDP-N- acetylglucosamine O-acyltransferase [Microbacterium sp.]
MNRIHPTAIIADGVQLGDENDIGPFAILNPGVVVGSRNWIGAGVVIGSPPEIRSFAHPRDEAQSFGAGVIIGSDNVFREYSQIHQGSAEPTRVGDGAFIMNQVYVAHDCSLGDGVTLASSVLLAGHVRIEARANLGLGTKVHQFRTVGSGAMVGMGSVVTADVPAFAKAYGVPARVVGANIVGMQRSGVSEGDSLELDRMYREGIPHADLVSRLI